VKAPRGLVVRGGALGDFLLSLPALERARASVDHLTLATRPRHAALRPDLWDALLDLDSPRALWLFDDRPLPEHFDWALVYTPGVAAGLRARGVPRVLEGPAQPPPGTPAIAAALAPLGGPSGGEAPRLWPDPLRAAAWARRLEGPGPAVVLAPGAGGRGKVWPGFAALAGALRARGACPWWLPGRDEGLPSNLSGPSVGDLDLADLTGLAGAAAAWCGNDTGTTHLAAAAGCPTVALFGPTDPLTWRSPGARALPFSTPPDTVADEILRGLRPVR
jgi:ADP-heptose:LPS heptosyltransferase